VTSQPSPPPPLPDLPAFAASRLYACRVFLFAAFVVPFLLRRRIDRLAPLIEPSARSRARVLPPLPPAAVDALVRRIHRLLLAGHPIIRSGCLTRGVTLYYFLRRAGAFVTLRFGMGEIDGAFSGHCWLEQDGEPLVEPQDPRPLFVEMFRIPSPPSTSASTASPVAPLPATGGPWTS
jgi:hypothetical protein